MLYPEEYLLALDDAALEWAWGRGVWTWEAIRREAAADEGSLRRALASVNPQADAETRDHLLGVWWRWRMHGGPQPGELPRRFLARCVRELRHPWWDEPRPAPPPSAPAPPPPPAVWVPAPLPGGGEVSGGLFG